MPIARANGIDLCYESFGDPAHRPLALIMGLASQLIVWPDDFCALLAAHGCFVVRFDNRDIGRSSRIGDRRRPALGRALLRAVLGLPVEAPYTLDDMADDTAGLLDALGLERAHVCGVSMGGMIAQTMAIRHPQRVLSLTSMMASTGRRFRALPRARVAATMFRRRPGGDGYVAHQVRLWRVLSSPAYPFEEDFVRARSQRAWQRGICYAGVARQLLAVIAQSDRRPALAGVRTPTLVIHGDRDPMVPPAGGRDTARAIPGARLRVFAGMGHDLPRALWPPVAELIADHTAAADNAERAAARASSLGPQDTVCRNSTKAPVPPSERGAST